MIEFDKAESTASVNVFSTAWKLGSENLTAILDNASITFTFNIKKLPKDTVTLYVVAEPPNDEKAIQSRAPIVQAVKEGEAKNITAIFQGGKVLIEGNPHSFDESNFAKRKVVCKREGRPNKEIEIGWADRHYVDTFEWAAESTQGVGECSLEFEKGSVVYVIYLTTEPLTHV